MGECVRVCRRESWLGREKKNVDGRMGDCRRNSWVKKSERECKRKGIK